MFFIFSLSPTTNLSNFLYFRIPPSNLEGVTGCPNIQEGSRYDPLNYRPISLTSICVKSLERIIAKFIYEHADSNHLFNNDQFGFRPGRSPEDQLILTYNDITLWLDKGFNVDLILFDFSKAFDVVCHDILIIKLYSLGIRGRLLD